MERALGRAPVRKLAEYLTRTRLKVAVIDTFSPTGIASPGLNGDEHMLEMAKIGKNCFQLGLLI
ncbi:hypothetical protein SAMN05216332_105160 [Nitrosospira briensis]|nr:hypothetical protein SAMN05216332_105160 [Nitrosospira briensis]